MAGARRRSVPGEQESLADDAVTSDCTRCRGRGTVGAGDLLVRGSLCGTCGGTGRVTALPRQAPPRRVRLEMTLEEATALLDGRPWPQTTVRLAESVARASER